MAVVLYPYFLPPANEVWGKVIFSVACVKNSVHRGSTWAGTPPSRYTPTQVHPHQGIPPGRYTPWACTLPHWAGTTLDRYTPLGQVHLPGRYPLGRYTPCRYTPSPRQVHQPGRYTPAAVHAGRYGQQAGSTHHTGKHSCLNTKISHFYSEYLWSLFSLHMWETICDAQAHCCTHSSNSKFLSKFSRNFWNFRPESPPPPFWKTSDLKWPKFTPEYPPPPISENFRFQMTKVYSPHFRKLQIWDDQSLLQNTPPPFRKTSDLKWPKFTLIYPPPHFGKLQIWDDQSLLRNNPSPFQKMWEIVCGIPLVVPVFERLEIELCVKPDDHKTLSCLAGCGRLWESRLLTIPTSGSCFQNRKTVGYVADKVM